MNQETPQIIFLRTESEEDVISRVLRGNHHSRLQQKLEEGNIDDIPVLLELTHLVTGDSILVIGSLGVGISVQVICVTITKDLFLEISYLSERQIRNSYKIHIPDQIERVVDYVYALKAVNDL